VIKCKKSRLKDIGKKYFLIRLFFKSSNGIMVVNRYLYIKYQKDHLIAGFLISDLYNFNCIYLKFIILTLYQIAKIAINPSIKVFLAFH